MVAGSFAGDLFEIEKTDGSIVQLEIPDYSMPDVPKRSAGYHAAPGMDLIDLFIGAEGTLGFVVEVELALQAPRPGWLVGLAQLSDDASAVALVAGLRAAAKSGNLDVVAIEYMDSRCLELLREDSQVDAAP